MGNNVDRMILGRAQCIEFIKSVTGVTKEISLDDERITKILSFSSTNDEKLIKDDFITFYKQSAFDNVGTVRQNLQKFGY